MPFDVLQRIMIFRRISLRSGGHGMDDKEHDFYIRHCIVHELFVVFIALFVVLNDKLFVWVVILTKLNYLLLIYLIISASI